MYTLAIYIYMMALRVAAIFNDRARLLVRGQRNALDQLRHHVSPQDHYIWFHAASLGEFEQGRPLMERLRRQRPHTKILLTFFSPSGYEVRKGWEGADVIAYLPLDTPRNVRRFLDLVHPEALFLIKYEFWPNYLTALHRRHIPVYSISSIFRPAQPFFHWWGRPYARVLNAVTHFFVQDEESRDLLATLGHTDNVTVVGDTRFDRVLDIRDAAKALPLVESFAANADIFVAGSSWPPDEDILIPWFLRRTDVHNSELRTHNSEFIIHNSRPLKLIIAPHLIHEGHLHDIETALAGRRVIRYTEALQQTAQPTFDITRYDVLIINTFGLLSSIYRYARVAMIGGGFGSGIHNIPEAAVYGLPTIIGPNNTNFREAQQLLAIHAAFQVNDANDFARIAATLLDDPQAYNAASNAARTYITSNAGATQAIITHLTNQAC